MLSFYHRVIENWMIKVYQMIETVKGNSDMILCHNLVRTCMSILNIFNTLDQYCLHGVKAPHHFVLM